VRKKYQKSHQRERRSQTGRTRTARNGSLATGWNRTGRSHGRFGRVPCVQYLQDLLPLPLGYHTGRWARSDPGRYGERQLGVHGLRSRRPAQSRLLHNFSSYMSNSRFFRAPHTDHCTNGMASSTTCKADRRWHHEAPWIFRFSTMQGAFPSSRL
jgi:hypothetical protein